MAIMTAGGNAPSPDAYRKHALCPKRCGSASHRYRKITASCTLGRKMALVALQSQRDYDWGII